MPMHVLYSHQLASARAGLLVHGGAGPRATELTLQTAGDYRQGLAGALDAGRTVLGRGQSALDAVCAAVIQLENNPLFNAGRGASLTRSGTAELDAAVMDDAGRAGAVAASRWARNPVLVARAVRDKSSHVLLVDPGETLLSQWGLEKADQDYFVTDHRLRQLKNILSADDEGPRSGTVGAVAIDASGHVACATSTGGMAGQAVGRVGDSALIGSGTFASNPGAAISCTGEGEAYIQGVVAHDIAARVRLAHSPLLDAVEATYDHEITARGATGGTIAVSPTGEMVIAHNSDAMFAGFWDGESTETYV